MDEINTLILAPFREIAEKGKEALENAEGSKCMVTQSQKLVRGSERILRTIEPQCTKLQTEFGNNLVDALKQNDEIAVYRSRLNDLLWDFEDYMTPDTFEESAYVDLQKLCKDAGLGISEILMRMRLEPVVKPREDRRDASSITATQRFAENEPQTEPDARSANEANRSVENQCKSDEAETEETHTFPKRLTPPPSPPTLNPWDPEKLPPGMDDNNDVDGALEENIERRPAVSVASDDEPEPIITATILPSSAGPRDSHGSAHSVATGSIRSPPFSPSEFPSPELTRTGRTESWSRMSIIDLGESAPSGRESAAGGPSGFEEGSDAESRAFTITPNFDPRVEDGIEAVPKAYNALEGLIPVNSSSSDHIVPTPWSSSATRTDYQQRCAIGLSSSFFLYRGFCEGAKAKTRGGSGVKKSKKAGLTGMHTIVKCSSCEYELDEQQMELDDAQSDDANLTAGGITYRARFLQKSHLPTKRADEVLYGCVFCIQMRSSPEECDATVFFTSKRLFEHIARHPRPLPHVPGFAVVEEAEVPFNLHNDYDIHLKEPPTSSPFHEVREDIVGYPAATATKTAKRMYGLRIPWDGDAAFELAEGARIVGIEFPSRYYGEWAKGWHDGSRKCVPLDIIRLEAPPTSEIRTIGGASSRVTAVARWKFSIKGKDGGGEWLKFDKGEVVSNIAWHTPEHWCWSGTNSKGKWGIFPQAYLDSNTVREMTAEEEANAIDTQGERRRSKGRLSLLSRNK